jgi:hypothetical protein
MLCCSHPIDRHSYFFIFLLIQNGKIIKKENYSAVFIKEKTGVQLANKGAAATLREKLTLSHNLRCLQVIVVNSTDQHQQTLLTFSSMAGIRLQPEDSDVSQQARAVALSAVDLVSDDDRSIAADSWSIKSEYGSTLDDDQRHADAAEALSNANLRAPSDYRFYSYEF